jgi:hypothetical protein
MMRVRIKKEFERDYIHLEPDQWYEVKMVVLDKVMLSDNALYLKRKFEVDYV